MASPFSGKAGRQAAMFAAQQASTLNDELRQIYRGAESKAGGYLGDAFKSGRNTLQTTNAAAEGFVNTGGQQAQQFLQQGMQGALDSSNAGYNQGRTDINTGLNQALGRIDGPGGAMDLTRGGYAEALKSLEAQYGKAGTELQGAADAWNPLVQRGMQGYDMYMNSLGLNGAEGNAAATGAFQAGPAYQWQQDQARMAAQRGANSTGSAVGGNAMDAVARLSSNLAKQEYGGWQDRLQGFQGATETATAGRAGALTNLGQLYAQQGQQEAGLHSQQGRDLAGLQTTAGGWQNEAGQQLGQMANNNGQFNAGVIQTGNTAMATNSTNMAQQLAALRSQYGLNQTNLRTQYGGAMAGLTTGTAQGIADAQANMRNSVSNAGQQGLMAGQQAAANRMGAVMGGLQLAGSAFGAVAGAPAGGFLSSLFGK